MKTNGSDKAKYITICYSFSDFKSNKVRIAPSEFLSWAKSDLKGGDKRSIGNALGNIKKAIHSRIDEIINSTHVTYAKDWDKNIFTDKKLEILKSLGIGYTSIVRIITEIRNVFEHKYILPTMKTTKAYYEITELWLNNSYQEHNNRPIGIANLPILNVISDQNRSIKEIIITDYVNIIYFWDNKKVIIETTKDRKNKTKYLKELCWKEILEKEKKYIKKINKSKDYYFLTQKNLTKLFKMYSEKLSRNRGFFPMRSSIKFD